MNKELEAEELKPCPFCGGEAEPCKIEGLHPPQFYIACKKCKAGTGGEHFSEEDASTTWNSRSSQNGGEVRERPKVVCFCGSSRFTPQMSILRWEWEKAGHITFGLNLLPSDYGVHKGWGTDFDHIAELEGISEQQDELHKRKIDLSDEIFVVNLDGYIGSSTRSEIEYAIAHNKPVRFLEDDKKPDWLRSLLSDKQGGKE